MTGVRGVPKHVCTWLQSSGVHITMYLEVAPLLAINDIEKLNIFTISMIIHFKFFCFILNQYMVVASLSNDESVPSKISAGLGRTSINHLPKWESKDATDYPH